MPMIQGIDGSALLAAFRQGRSDRSADDQAQAAKAKQEQIGGLIGQLFPQGQSGGGVAGQYAPSQPAQRATMPVPETFMQAPEQAPQTPSAGPVVAPSAPMQAPTQRMAGPDPNILMKLTVLDPEYGGKVASVLKTMGEADLAAFQKGNDAMGHVAHWIEQETARNPKADARQLLASTAGYLRSAGISDEQIAQADTSPQGLRMYYGRSLDMDKLHDNELADREFMMGKTVAIPDGGNLATVKPVIGADGSVGTKTEYAIGGPGEQPSVQVQSIEEAMKLPPGTHFRDPNGVERVVPGGGAGNGTDGFPE